MDCLQSTAPTLSERSELPFDPGRAVFPRMHSAQPFIRFALRSVLARSIKFDLQSNSVRLTFRITAIRVGFKSPLTPIEFSS